METFTSKVVGREKIFTIGGKAKVVKCKDWYESGIDESLVNAGYKEGDVVTIVGSNSAMAKWPIIEGVDDRIDPDCLEPLPITAEEIKAEISKHQSEIAKREKEIEELKFQLTQLTLKES